MVERASKLDEEKSFVLPAIAYVMWWGYTCIFYRLKRTKCWCWCWCWENKIKVRKKREIGKVKSHYALLFYLKNIQKYMKAQVWVLWKENHKGTQHTKLLLFNLFFLLLLSRHISNGDGWKEAKEMRKEKKWHENQYVNLFV